MESSQDRLADPGSNDRRSFLAACGKYSLLVPPAMTMLLSTSLSSPAIARSGGGGGGGGSGSSGSSTGDGQSTPHSGPRDGGSTGDGGQSNAGDSTPRATTGPVDPKPAAPPKLPEAPRIDRGKGVGH